MKKTAKRLLSALLACCMALGLCAAALLPAGAATPIYGPTGITLTEGYEQTSVGGYLTNNVAITNCEPAWASDYVYWVNAYTGLVILPGLTAGEYTITLTSTSGPGDFSTLDFKLIVNGGVCEIVGGEKYASFQKAIDAAASGQTIRMLKTHTCYDPIVVDGKALFVDMGNNTMVVYVSSASALTVKGGGMLLQTGGGTGKFCLTSNGSGSAVVTNGGLVAQGAGTEVVISCDEIIAYNTNCRGVIAEGGAKVTVTGSVKSYNSSGVNTSGADTEVTINGNAETSTSSSGSGAAATAGSGAKVTINGDAIGREGVSAGGAGTKITVNGSVTATGNNGVSISTGGEATVTGSVTANSGRAINASGGKATIGGDITSGFYAVDASDTFKTGAPQLILKGNVIGRVLVKDGAQVTIDGEIINSTGYIGFNSINRAASEFTTPTTKVGYYTYTDGTSTVWVKNTGTQAVCEIVGGEKFDWFKAAIDAAEDGQTIRLLGNASETSLIVVDGKTVFFDLGDYTLTFVNSAPFTNGTALTVKNGGKFLQIGTGAGKLGFSDLLYAIKAETGGVVTIYSNVEGTQYGIYAEDVGSEITVNGTVVGAVSGVNARHGAKVTVNGDVIGSVGSGTFGGGVIDTGGAEIFITGSIKLSAYNHGGVTLYNGVQVTVGGNIASSTYGVELYNSGPVIVEGYITAPEFLRINDTLFSEDDFAEESTREGYNTYTNGVSTVWVTTCVVDPFCENMHTGARFNRLPRALDAIENGQTLRLITDYVLDNDMVISNGKTFTFDTNNHVLDFDGHDIMIQNGSNVTFIGCAKLLNLGNAEAIGDSGGGIVFNGSVSAGGLEAKGLEVVKDGRRWGSENAPMITVNGNADITDCTNSNLGIEAELGGKVTVNGGVTLAAEGARIWSWLEGVVTVTGSVTAASDWGASVNAFYGTIVIGGDVMFSRIGSNITSQGDLEAPALVSVGGNLYGKEDTNILVSGGCKVHIAGHFFSELAYPEYPVIEARNPGSEVTVGGLTTLGIAALVWDGAKVTFNGDVRADGPYGVVCATSGTVSVNGTLRIAQGCDYILFCRVEGANAYFLNAVEMIPAAKTPYPNVTAIGGVDYHSYLYDDGENGVSAVYVKVGVPPTFTGPTELTLTTGYGAVSTGVYTLTGEPAPTVTKVSGPTQITWNSSTKQLDIAPSLAAGVYAVVLTASNDIEPDASLTFTLTVNAAPTITGATAMALKKGYAAISTDAYTLIGYPTPTVTKVSGPAQITWNSSTKQLDIAPGLAAGTYAVVLRASSGVAPDAELTFKLTVLKTIFSTGYESTFWNWVLFILGFGWIWMWF